GADPKEVKAVADKAIAYLKKTQAADGSWSSKFTGPGCTALIVAAMIRNGVGPDDPAVAKAIKYLENNVKKDGGIYNKDTGLANYTTSIAVMALQEANRDKKYDAVLKNASAYLKGLQQQDDDKDVKFGGVGYDEKSRPDLSNTQMFVEAMIAA